MKTAILSAALMLASTAAMAQKSNFQLKVDLKKFQFRFCTCLQGQKC